MEWIPKYLDNLDSAALALIQSWAGYYRWVILRAAITIVAVAAITVSPAIRVLVVAFVMTFILVEALDRLILRPRRFRVARANI